MDWAQALLTGGFSSIFTIIAVFGRGYLSEKGKNQATKEDVHELTRKVEDVRAEYARGLASLNDSLNARTTLRMLAGERRLATHQEAYSRWHMLLISAAFSGGERYADECTVWWRDNALFLDAEPRDRFMLAVAAARVHHSMVEVHRGKGPEAAELVVANMDKIRAAGPAIVRACDLPPLALDAGNDVPAMPPRVSSPTVTHGPAPRATQ